MSGTRAGHGERRPVAGGADADGRGTGGPPTDGRATDGRGGGRTTVGHGTDGGATDGRGRGRGGWKGGRPGGRARRRPAAAACVLMLAGALALAGCSGGSGGSGAHSDAAPAKAAPAGAGSGRADSGGSGGGSGDGSNSADASGAKNGASTGAAAKPGTGTSPAVSGPTYLIRTAELTVRTPHVEQQLDRARTYAAQEGGYAGDEDTSVDSAGRAQSTVQLRVPAAAYDRLLGELAGLGTLVDRQASVKDVTGQVVDVQSRIASQRASVARVRALMDQAGSLSDVVSLESELSTRESDLESMEAQQASLKSQANLATVTLHLTQPPAARKAAVKEKHAHDGFWTTVGHALRGGWHAFSATVRTVLVVLAVLLPFAVVAAAGWLLWRLTGRRRLPVRPSLSAGRLARPEGRGEPREQPGPAGDPDATEATPPGR